MNGNGIHQLQIRTPEGIVFAHQLAGPVTRCLAWLVDAGCIAIGWSVMGALAAMAGLIARDFGFAVYFIGLFVVSFGYGILLEWAWRGQTVGKRLLRLRVIDAHGFRLRFSQIVIRNLLRLVDRLPLFYLVGGVACVASRHAQRLGDLAAGTIVVRQPAIGAPNLDQVASGKFNSFWGWPHLAARLRQNVSPAEAALALDALLQRDRLDPDARLELYRELADHFRGKTAFPQEATDGLSDEQYVRNVVEIVFSSRK